MLLTAFFACAWNISDDWSGVFNLFKFDRTQKKMNVKSCIPELRIQSIRRAKRWPIFSHRSQTSFNFSHKRISNVLKNFPGVCCICLMRCSAMYGYCWRAIIVATVLSTCEWRSCSFWKYFRYISHIAISRATPSLNYGGLYRGILPPGHDSL